MPATLVQPAQTVPTTLSYFSPPSDGSRAFSVVSPTPGQLQKNYLSVKHTAQIENIRGNESSVSLDTTGFQFYLNEPTKHKSFQNDEEIEKEYYPESIELIKKLTGASRVVLFDHSKSFLLLACLLCLTHSRSSQTSPTWSRWSGP